MRQRNVPASSLRAQGWRAHSSAQGRQCQPDALPASSALAQCTWRRICLRLSWRRGAACPEPRAPGALRGDSCCFELALQLFRRGSISPRKRHVVVLEQAVVGQALQRREVAVRDVPGTLEAPYVIRHRAQAQIDADPIPGREVGSGGMHQTGVKQNHRSGWTFWSHDAAALDEFPDGVVVDRPKRVAGRGGVVVRFDHSQLVAAGNEHQRSVELVDLVEEDRDVHRASLGHQIVVLPGAVVLVPLPDVAVESHLAVNLELVHIQLFAEQLHDRLDHARMARELRERQAVHVRGEVRAHRVTALLANVLRPALGVEPRHLVYEDFDLAPREQAGKKEVAIALEPPDLFLTEFHAAFLLGGRSSTLLPTIPHYRAPESLPAAGKPYIPPGKTLAFILLNSCQALRSQRISERNAHGIGHN